MQTPEQNEIEALQIARAVIEARSEKIVHNTWFYDGSCNSWEPPNAESEDIIIRHGNAVKLIDDLLGEYPIEAQPACTPPRPTRGAP